MSSLTKESERTNNLPLEKAAELCRKWHISRLEVFGSAVRSDFGKSSDVDLLYTLRDDAQIGWDIVCVAEDFENLLGRPVDLVSRRAVENSPNWIRRRNILNSAKTIYVE
jgi:uncharacterized protein